MQGNMLKKVAVCIILLFVAQPECRGLSFAEGAEFFTSLLRGPVSIAEGVSQKDGVSAKPGAIHMVAYAVRIINDILIFSNDSNDRVISGFLIAADNIDFFKNMRDVYSVSAVAPSSSADAVAQPTFERIAIRCVLLPALEGLASVFFAALPYDASSKKYKTALLGFLTLVRSVQIIANHGDAVDCIDWGFLVQVLAAVLNGLIAESSAVQHVSHQNNSGEREHLVNQVIHSHLAVGANESTGNIRFVDDNNIDDAVTFDQDGNIVVNMGVSSTVENGNECPVCLSEWRECESSVCITSCGHALCRDCVEHLAHQANKRCPLCRADIDQVKVIAIEDIH